MTSDSKSKEIIRMIITKRTHQGHKKNKNEDNFLVREIEPEETLLLVADGLGGHPGGDVASSLLVQFVAEQTSDTLHRDLNDLLVRAGESIMRYGASHPDVDGMGSTATLAMVKGKTVRWSHVGDGRLYHFQNDELRCITRDHTLARTLYDQGEITWDEIRGHKLNHFLEQCLGEDEPEPDSGSFECQPGDILLLNTDGLHDMVLDSDIQAILADNGDLEKKADKLLQGALDVGGKDNITFLLCRL
jgi:protein phosphatase